jgi:hypothetical protein
MQGRPWGGLLFRIVAASTAPASMALPVPASQQKRLAYVRFGSKADITPSLEDYVRFTPQKRTYRRRLDLSALCQKQTFALQHIYSITSSAKM